MHINDKKPNYFQRLWLNIQYAFASLKDNNRYPYILEGETLNNTSSKTIFLYRVRGKNAIFEMSAQDICNDQGLITKFHPHDVRIIAYIAGIEQILNIPANERQNKFFAIKNKIFNH